MVKVGRNQPCPCGSGKKYKQCCLTADEAMELAAREEQRRNLPPPPARTTAPRWTPADDDDDYAERLDQMSNGTVDLIRAGKLDEAERMCHRLLDDFPDLPDGYIRLGQLFRVRGQPKQAAQHLRLAAAAARALNDDPSMSLSLKAEADELDPPAP